MMMNLLRVSNSRMRLSAALGAMTLLAVPFYVSAQRGRAVPGRIQTLTPYFLLKGDITAIEGSLATVKTADYGPGLTGGPGIHSHAILLGKSYLVDLSNARFQATDGTGVTRQPLLVGDKVIMLVTSKPGPPVQVGNTTMFKFTVNEVIRNDQTP